MVVRPAIVKEGKREEGGEPGEQVRWEGREQGAAITCGGRYADGEGRRWERLHVRSELRRTESLLCRYTPGRAGGWLPCEISLASWRDPRHAPSRWHPPAPSGTHLASCVASRFCTGGRTHPHPYLLPCGREVAASLSLVSSPHIGQGRLSIGTTIMLTVPTGFGWLGWLGWRLAGGTSSTPSGRLPRPSGKSPPNERRAYKIRPLAGPTKWSRHTPPPTGLLTRIAWPHLPPRHPRTAAVRSRSRVAPGEAVGAARGICSRPTRAPRRWRRGVAGATARRAPVGPAGVNQPAPPQRSPRGGTQGRSAPWAGRRGSPGAAAGGPVGSPAVEAVVGPRFAESPLSRVVAQRRAPAESVAGTSARARAERRGWAHSGDRFCVQRIDRSWVQQTLLNLSMQISGERCELVGWDTVSHTVYPRAQMTFFYPFSYRGKGLPIPEVRLLPPTRMYAYGCDHGAAERPMDGGKAHPSTVEQDCRPPHHWRGREELGGTGYRRSHRHRRHPYSRCHRRVGGAQPQRPLPPLPPPGLCVCNPLRAH